MPDFIIGGAMKSGTSSLHLLLHELPDVFMPRPELFYFDVDDVEQHPEFFSGPDGAWAMPRFAFRNDKYFARYASYFQDAPATALTGEDSTTYLASGRAPRRIRAALPDVRLIFLLRDPAQRTYSHYWHLVRSGRATAGFEETLRTTPGTLLQRSVYRPQVERYLELFPRDQLRFVLFEEFVEDPLATLRSVATFLGIRVPDMLPAPPHHNPARIPRSTRLHLAGNRVFGRQGQRPARAVLEEPRSHGIGMSAGWTGRLMRLNLTQARPPQMATNTRRALNGYFAVENEGVGELTSLNVAKHWYRPA